MSKLTDAESLAKAFHEAYERLAPSFSYDTRKDSAKPWNEVPENNRQLMIAVCSEILSLMKSNHICGEETVMSTPSGLSMSQSWIDSLVDGSTFGPFNRYKLEFVPAHALCVETWQIRDAETPGLFGSPSVIAQGQTKREAFNRFIECVQSQLKSVHDKYVDDLVEKMMSEAPRE